MQSAGRTGNNRISAPPGLYREHSECRGLWVRREAGGSLSTVADVRADIQGEVEVTLLLRIGRPGRVMFPADAAA